ncbi:MAG: penicillin acylase family protein [Chloroflexi bacterium]|nr:penicillin acylase family protein [Chloroflexota bacterium]
MSSKETITLSGSKGKVVIRRMAHGFPHISADDRHDQYYGLGYAHGRDRQLHMWLLKLIGQGRASEKLMASDELIEADKFMRWINLAGDAVEEAKHLLPEAQSVLAAYCKGVNEAVAAHKTPFEFRTVGYKPDAWTPADGLLLAKMIGYVGLAQAQGDGEKFIIQLLQNGLDSERLKALFPPITEDISPELVEIIKQIELKQPVIDASMSWRRLVPSFANSNNWVICPEKTASGKAMMCADPHLALQLPSIWYTAVLSSGDDYLMGATVPGLPVIAIGRSPNLAWAATYGAADVSDYFIEEVRDGRYKHGDEWLPFNIREETIHPKKKEPITLRIHETHHGILEGEPGKDGYYLCYGWASKQTPNTGAESIQNFFNIANATNAKEAHDYFAGLTFAPFNWVFADKAGNIGYQLAGLCPKQADGSSGLLPYLGWDKVQDWDGNIDPHLYPRTYNPEAGFIGTSNQDLNHFGKIKPMNLPMPSYRADRIADLLKDGTSLTIADMKQIHYDRYSLQAELFMKHIRPLLPDSQNGNILRQWDLRYEADSLGATLFEQIYRELVLLVFGENGLGKEMMIHIMNETGIFAMLHGNFDAVLLAESSPWFGNSSREAIFKIAIERGLQNDPKRHRETRKVYLENLFFGGQLPKFLGFDYPLEHIGSRATIPQSQIFQANGRSASFAATLRQICDFAHDELHTNLAGGASDRRFSKYYTSGLKEWENGVYDLLKP